MTKFRKGLTQKQMHRCLDAKMHSLNNVKDYAKLSLPNEGATCEQSADVRGLTCDEQGNPRTESRLLRTGCPTQMMLG